LIAPLFLRQASRSALSCFSDTGGAVKEKADMVMDTPGTKKWKLPDVKSVVLL
jgi:hypothetical protein